jgi:hypothetical protein
MIDDAINDCVVAGITDVVVSVGGNAGKDACLTPPANSHHPPTHMQLLLVPQTSTGA